jgi:hypothetical protein
MEAKQTKWVDLRDARGQLQARLNPQALELSIKQHGETTVYDLSRYLTQIPQISQGSLQPDKNMVK